MRISTSQRLKQIMSERNLKQVDILRNSIPLQKKLGIKMGKSTLSQYVTGKQSPDDQRYYLLSKLLDVSEPWLMGFDVPKERIPDDKRGTIKKDNVSNADITTLYNQLEPPRKKVVYETAEQQLEEQHKEQNNVVNLKDDPYKDSIVKHGVDTMAARFTDPEKGLPEGVTIEELKAYLEAEAKRRGIESRPD
ncbi:helix-turn-helix domain-containing protein [Enterococcus sp. BWB1-3]|uniref:helix-turn-helix domain-containing protein n=1 Tax=Enterococcus sp. BWB1-3 TaxID=2787713 RepID=UPI0019234580|nr:helix-turn-helix domain-containing protein [Enterococcus sp. BWB1-3]